jgi:hypothetical protein
MRDYMPCRLAHPLLFIGLMTVPTLRLLRRFARRGAACYGYGLPWRGKGIIVSLIETTSHNETGGGLKASHPGEGTAWFSARCHVLRATAERQRRKQIRATPMRSPFLWMAANYGGTTHCNVGKQDLSVCLRRSSGSQTECPMTLPMMSIDASRHRFNACHGLSRISHSR